MGPGTSAEVSLYIKTALMRGHNDGIVMPVFGSITFFQMDRLILMAKPGGYNPAKFDPSGFLF